MLILTFLSVTGTVCAAFVSVKLRIFGFAVLIVSNVGWLIVVDKGDVALVGLFGSYLGIAVYGLWAHVKLYRRLGEKRVSIY